MTALMSEILETGLDLAHASDLALVAVYLSELRRGQFKKLGNKTRRALRRYGILKLATKNKGRVNSLTDYGLSLLEEAELARAGLSMDVKNIF